MEAEATLLCNAPDLDQAAVRSRHLLNPPGEQAGVMHQDGFQILERHEPILVNRAVIPAQFTQAKQEYEDVGFLNAQAGSTQRQLCVRPHVAVRGEDAGKIVNRVVPVCLLRCRTGL